MSASSSSRLAIALAVGRRFGISVPQHLQTRVHLASIRAVSVRAGTRQVGQFGRVLITAFYAHICVRSSAYLRVRR
jgi:hypothetical protein